MYRKNEEAKLNNQFRIESSLFKKDNEVLEDLNRSSDQAKKELQRGLNDANDDAASEIKKSFESPNNQED